MKHNVDLTTNRTFSSATNISVMPNIYFVETNRLPWFVILDKIEFNDDLERQTKKIIVTGSKKNRIKIYKYKQINSSDYCDCCGIKMNLIPWDKEIGTCKKCTEHYESSFDKCIWRNKNFSSMIYK